MAAVASIVLADALATPVNHTFIPQGPDPKTGTWWFEDQSATDVLGYNRISLRMVRPPLAAQGSSSGNRVNRVQVAIYTPFLETLGTNDAGVTPPPTLAATPTFRCEFTMNERTSLQKRKDLRKFAQFLLAEAQTLAMIETLQAVY